MAHRMIFFIAGCGVMVTGCHSEQRVPSPPSTSVSVDLKSALTITPTPVRELDAQTFTVRLTDAQGHPVAGAHVTVDLVMPEMDMGKNEVATTSRSSGVYQGTGRFTMPGRWNAVVAARKGQEKTVRTVPVTVQ